MAALLVFNPRSGRGNTMRQRVTRALRRENIEFELVPTQKQGHAEEIAAGALTSGRHPVLVAGGDGTVSEVVNGLLRTRSEEPVGPLGIIPLGSGNDLAYALGIPSSVDEAVRLIARGEYRPMDVGRVNNRYFVNNVGLGLESLATALRERIKIPGLRNYPAAALVALLKKPEWRMELQWDGERNSPELRSLVSVCNGPRAGGKFHLAPHADPTDGRLTMLYGYARTRRRLLLAMLKTLSPHQNSHLAMAGIHEVHLKNLRVTSAPATPVHADGEVLAPTRTLSFSILPEKLLVFRGPPDGGAPRESG